MNSRLVLKNYVLPVAAVILSSVFFFSAIAKIFYWPDTVLAMESLVLNNSLALVVTALIITFELLLSIFLLQPKHWKLSGFISISILIIFTVVVFWGKLQGLITECSCFGNLFGAKIGATLIARNSLLLLCGLCLCSHKRLVDDVSSQTLFPIGEVLKKLRSLRTSWNAVVIRRPSRSTATFLVASLVFLSTGLGVYLLSKRWVGGKRADHSFLGRERSQLSEVPLIGKAFPSFNLVDLNGIKIKSDESSTRALLLFFISNIYCSPCTDAAGVMQAIHDDFKQAGLMVIGVSHSPHTAAVRRFVRRFALKYPFIMDSNLEFRKRLELPASAIAIVLVDSEDLIVGAWTTLQFESAEVETLKHQIKSLTGSSTPYKDPY